MFSVPTFSSLHSAAQHQRSSPHNAHTRWFPLSHKAACFADALSCETIILTPRRAHLVLLPAKDVPATTVNGHLCCSRKWYPTQLHFYMQVQRWTQRDTKSNKTQECTDLNTNVHLKIFLFFFFNTTLYNPNCSQQKGCRIQWSVNAKLTIFHCSIQCLCITTPSHSENAIYMAQLHYQISIRNGLGC